MLVSSVQYSPYSSIKFNQKPAFTGGKPINLYYIIEKRSNLLPERILKKVRRIVDKSPKQLPTLKEVHLKTYAPLLECKTLDEAKSLFPEFSGMKEADISFKRYSGNIKKLVAGGYLEDNFSLKILQEFWGRLKSQDEVAKEMGLDGRTCLAWVLQKIGFVNYNTNYKTLLMASSPDSRAKIAAKTTAWNAAHPDLMRARNKHAAQSMKKPENRKAHSERMKKHFEEHPERRKQISETSKAYWADPKHRAEHSNRGLKYEKMHPEKAQHNSEFQKMVWERLDEARKIMSTFFKDYVSEDKVKAARLRAILEKRNKHIPLSPSEKGLFACFNKAMYNAHPELKAMISDACQAVRKEISIKK